MLINYNSIIFTYLKHVFHLQNNIFVKIPVYLKDFDQFDNVTEFYI